MKYILSLSLLLLVNLLAAQKHDAHWVFGREGHLSDLPSFGLSFLRFDDFGKIDTFARRDDGFEMDVFNVSMSDADGRLAFYCNGVGLENADGDLMVNGDGMSGFPGSTGEEGGYVLVQGGVGIPWPGDDGRYMMVHENSDWWPNQTRTLESYFTEIDLRAEGGLGAVLRKRVPYTQDTLKAGRNMMCRHGNGRDWWLLKHVPTGNRFISALASPPGIAVVDTQYVGQAQVPGLGQNCFSPDGTKYAIFNTVSSSVGRYVHIYDFDRCTGQLSNPINLHYPHDGGSGGVAFSPDSRYMYISSARFVYQYDMHAANIPASRITVAEYDGFIDPFPTSFFLAQLAPDGRIYINCPNGVPWLHRIEYPNRVGDACTVLQHSVRLPTSNRFSLPNNPYYRLGPWDGSPCDTLGIDNVPHANYRADQDSTDYRSFYFQDLSDYEPATWEWSFGDGSTAQDTSPVHTYAQDGVYEVCLTVSNANGSHTACDTLYLGVVSTSDAEAAPALRPQVFPNPFQDVFTFVLNDYYPRQGLLLLYDAAGRPVLQQRIFHGWNAVEAGGLPPGIYYYEFRDGAQRLAAGKVVKI